MGRGRRPGSFRDWMADTLQLLSFALLALSRSFFYCTDSDLFDHHILFEPRKKYIAPRCQSICGDRYRCLSQRTRCGAWRMGIRAALPDPAYTFAARFLF